MSARTGDQDGGFTLLELVVAMGLLASFLLMLVRLLGTGADMFNEGERGQETMDRAQAAARACRDALLDGAGPRLVGRSDGQPDARLLVSFAPLGGVPNAPRTQVLRSTVRLSPSLEDELLAAAFRAQVSGVDEQEVDRQVRERLATHPRSGRGEMLLLAWPADPDGVFLDLRRGDRPEDPLLLPEDEVALVELGDPKDLELSPERVLASTRVVATGLLHFELAFWSQRTEAWGGGARGPERSWDSARGGLLTSAQAGQEDFGLDVGPVSLRDPRDDVWPRWVRVTLVVARSPNAPPESYLAAPVGVSDQTLTVTRPEELPDPADDPWLKVESEWVRFQGVSGTTLTGVRRGERGTVARPHTQGSAVRAGREVVIDVPLAHGRDADD